MYRLVEKGEITLCDDEYWQADRWHTWGPYHAGNPLVLDVPVRRLVKPAVTAKADTNEGYRMLSVGEKLRAGDEIYVGKWEVIVSALVGTTMKDWDRSQVRRKITPAASSVPDPGEGWRLLKEGEKIQKDDEFLNISSVKGEWFPCFMHVGAAHSSKEYAIRRRVPQSAQVVSVGDRVKVLSGPWAGCTGVVLSWSVEITITGGEMKSRTESQPVVRLDHVWVGGQRLCLTLAAIDAEKLPPVVPEVLYRDLSHGETIRKGDEYQFGCGWLAGSTDVRCVGKLEKWHVRHRRPVRVQSPGWRYLDAGETVKAGDEVSFGNGFWWEQCPQKAGKTVQDYSADCFRRKLPANQGG